MLRMISRLCIAALFVAGGAAAQVNLVAGKDYTILPSPQATDGDAAIEVLEFFAYGCIHCYTLEPKLDAWAKKAPKDTKMKRVPTPFKLRGVDSIPLYYTLEAMGLVDKLHLKVFEAIHNDNIVLGNPEVLMQWLAKNGVDVKKFQDIEKSFSIVSKSNRARSLTQNYQIESTPTMIVNGKYAVANQNAPERTFQIVDGLAQAARLTAQAAATKPAATK